MTDAIRTYIPIAVPERSTRVYSTTLRDENGVAIQLGDVVSIKLTLYNADAALTIVNARDHVDVKNSNGGTFDAISGLFTFPLLPADTAIVDAATSSEIRRMLLEVVYSGVKEMAHEVQFTVVNMARRPSP